MILYYISLTLITGCVIATVLQAVLRGFAGNFKLYYLMRVISTLTIFLATFRRPICVISEFILI